MRRREFITLLQHCRRPAIRRAGTAGRLDAVRRRVAERRRERSGSAEASEIPGEPQNDLN